MRTIRDLRAVWKLTCDGFSNAGAVPDCGAHNEMDAILCSNPDCNKALTMDAPVGNPYGIALDDDRYKIIIPVGTRYPMNDPIYEKFYTVQHNQSFIAIAVYQGENMDRASRNAWQGQITLTIPTEKRGPAGLPVRVGMGIDRDGVLTVSVCGEGPLQGVQIAVQVDRSQKALLCTRCGRRNPQEAPQCSACSADLVHTGFFGKRSCSRCNNSYDSDAPACPRCGFRPPVVTDSFKRALNFQLVLARIGCSELDWIVPVDLLATLRPFVVQAEHVVEHGDRAECDAMTQRLSPHGSNSVPRPRILYASFALGRGHGSAATGDSRAVWRPGDRRKARR